MKNQGAPGIDLSSLPPAVRARVEQALSRLPPEQLRQFQQHGSPVLQKLVTRMSQAAGQHGMPSPPALPTRSEAIHAVKAVVNARIAPHGHYNQTIRPGDRGGRTLMRVVMFALVAALVWTFWP